MLQHQQHEQSEKIRDELTGEHPAGHIVQFSLAILFFAVWIADCFFIELTTQLNQFVPLVIRIPLGIVLLFVSYYLIKQSHALVFHEKREKPGVIQDGVYGVVRHPMYLSELLLYLGLVVLNISLAALLVWVLAFGFLHYIARYEERLLLGRFGAEYAAYMREVSMWMPWIRV